MSINLYKPTNFVSFCNVIFFRDEMDESRAGVAAVGSIQVKYSNNKISECVSQICYRSFHPNKLTIFFLYLIKKTSLLFTEAEGKKR